jgi:RNA polymerase sigma-70 factor (ECF subfamily)
VASVEKSPWPNQLEALAPVELLLRPQQAQVALLHRVPQGQPGGREAPARKPRFEASRRRREELARRFLEAVGQGDTEGLLGLLAADVVAYADGGGKTQTFTRPVYGRERIARLLPGFGTWLELLGAQELRLAEVNGQPWALFLGHDRRAVLVVSLDIADGLVQAIRAITNPEKLRHLDPIARRPGPLAR